MAALGQVWRFPTESVGWALRVVLTGHEQLTGIWWIWTHLALERVGITVIGTALVVSFAVVRGREIGQALMTALGQERRFPTESVSGTLLVVLARHETLAGVGRARAQLALHRGGIAVVGAALIIPFAIVRVGEVRKAFHATHGQMGRLGTVLTGRTGSVAGTCYERCTRRRLYIVLMLSLAVSWAGRNTVAALNG